MNSDGKINTRAILILLIRNWILIFLFFVSLIYLGHFLWVSATRIISWYANSAIEPQPVAGAMRFINNEPLYQDYRIGRPVIPLPYGVLEYAVPGLTAKIIGTKDALSVLRLGRIYSFLSAVGIVIVLSILASQRGVPYKFSFIAFLPLVWFPYILEWFAKFAPDTPALLCSLGGWAILRPPNLSNSRTAPFPSVSKMILSLIVWTMGFHFKPIIIAGQIGFGVECISTILKQRKSSPERSVSIFGKVLILYISYLFLVLVTSGMLDWTTRGLWHLNCISSMSKCPFKLIYISMSLKFLRTEYLIVFLLMVLLAVLFSRRNIIFISFLITLLTELISLSKQGSNVNYLSGSISIWGLGIIIYGWEEFKIYICRMRANLDEKITIRRFVKEIKPFFGWSIWLFLSIAIILMLNTHKAKIINWEAFIPYRDELARIDRLVMNVPTDRLLCLDGFYGLSREVPFIFADSYHAGILSRQGIVSFSREVENLRKHQYDFVIWNLLHYRNIKYHKIPTFPEEIGNALEENYKVSFVGRWLVLWTPEKLSKDI